MENLHNFEKTAKKARMRKHPGFEIMKPRSYLKYFTAALNIWMS